LQFKNNFIVSFVIIFGTLSFPISDKTPGTDFQGAVVQWGRTRPGGDYLADDARLLTTELQSADGSGASYYLSRGVRTFAHEHMPPPPEVCFYAMRPRQRLNVI